MNKVEARWIIDERVDGVYNDLKAFVYVRIHNLQHGDENIGGGNITQAIALFSVLNFLSKIQFFLDGEKIILRGSEEPQINEERAFVHLIRKLHESGIDLGIPHDNGDAITLAWKGFRNKLSHVTGVEDGKQVMTFTINNSNSDLDVLSFLDKVKNLQAFTHDGNLRNWKINVDVLLSQLPMIKQTVISQILNAKDDEVNFETLEQVVG